MKLHFLHPLAPALLTLLLAPLAPHEARAASLEIHPVETTTSFPLALPETLLAEPQVRLDRGTSETVWVSDIEDVFWPPTGELFLADAPKPRLFARDRIPAGQRFQLFPYHYAAPKYEAKTGGPVRYRLAVRNDTTRTLNVKLDGAGTTLGWAHWRAWNGALTGEGRAAFALAPGAERTLWQTGDLKAGDPWSGVFLGETDGELTVLDYCFRGPRDPGARRARMIPDMAWPPWANPSFTRGTADWFTGEIVLLPAARTPAGELRASALAGAVRSVAFGYGPGGPITGLCEYKAVPPSFAADTLNVKDPVSGHTHAFFGGNYPVVYRMRLPLRNDTAATVTATLFLSSNDRFGVDTQLGVWMGGRVLERRAPAIAKGARWRVWTARLGPGETVEADMRIVALGGLWAGTVASLAVE